MPIPLFIYPLRVLSIYCFGGRGMSIGVLRR